MSLAAEIGELFNAWATAARVALIVARPDGIIDFANTECTDLTGLTQGDHLLAAFHLSEVARAKALLNQLRTEGIPVDTTAALADGETIGRFLIAHSLDSVGNELALIGAFRDVTPQGLHERQLEHDARHDDLTGALTRAAAITALEQHFECESSAPPAVLFVDLDDFKGINDGYGHLIGDEVLKIVAQRIQGAVGRRHLLARMGGDEFLVVLRPNTTAEQAERLAHTVRDALSAPVVIGDANLRQRFSIGVAVSGSTSIKTGESFPGIDLDSSSESPRTRAQQLLGEADMAMYVAKRGNVPIAVADDSTRLWSLRRRVIERDLNNALRVGQVHFHYQPVMNLSDGRCVGAEALMRWRHPDLGLIPPDLVVERAEVIGCIEDLTRYTANRVIQDWSVARRRVAVPSGFKVSINATARQLSWNGFARAHVEVANRVGLNIDDLVIEVVESSEIELRDRAQYTLNRIADEGMQIALDDFGVGYSALAYFTRFPINAVKIDRSLLTELRGGSHGVAERLLRGVVRIADDLGAVVVGEGIESEASARMCGELGIAIGQGWHFAPAMPLLDFCAFAEQNRLGHDQNQQDQQNRRPADPPTDVVSPPSDSLDMSRPVGSAHGQR